MKEYENNLDREFKAFYNEYSEKVYSLLKQVDLDSMQKLVKKIIECYKHNKAIFLIGNGGSATTCTHMATDIGIGINKKVKLQHPFKIMSLTDNISSITAISNDINYDDIFKKQLEMYFNEGDLVIAISASGNSINLVKTIEWANSCGGETVGIVGFDGGKLNDIVGLSVHVKSDIGEYGPVEDVHLIINHMLTQWMENEQTIMEC